LAAHFIGHYNRPFGKNIQWISQRALDALRRHDWPGNVHEFSHAIQSAVMLTDSDRIDVQMLPETVRGVKVTAPTVEAPIEKTDARMVEPEMVIPPPPNNPDSGPLLLDEVIKRRLVRSLEETEGNRRRAADLLGISCSTLYRMLARYSLAEEETGRSRPRTEIDRSSGSSGFGSL